MRYPVEARLYDSFGNPLMLVDGKLQVAGTFEAAAGGATEAKQDTEIATLAALLAKVIAAPATEAKQDAIIAALALLAQDSAVDGVEALLAGLGTETTLAALLAKVIAAPATEAKQDAAAALLTRPTATARLLTAAASVNATNVKGSAGAVFGFDLTNAAGAARYLKLYDKATAPSEADTPRRTIELPAFSSVVLDWPRGLAFALGIGYRLTTGIADADTGALAAGDVRALNLDYA